MEKKVIKRSFLHDLLRRSFWRPTRGPSPTTIRIRRELNKQVCPYMECYFAIGKYGRETANRFGDFSRLGPIDTHTPGNLPHVPDQAQWRRIQTSPTR
jgi:hypothetical protein